MNILQVSTFDIAGGAEKVAWSLFQAYRVGGHGSWLAVGTKRTTDPDVLPIAGRRAPGPIARGLWRLAGSVEWREQFVPALWPARRILRLLAGGAPELDTQLGREDFNYPGSRKLLQLAPRAPHVVHAHNLHTGYFDLGFLSQLSQQVATVVTLHDEWLLTGHCAGTLNCRRWETGCGQCPHLTTYPAIERDATNMNWRRKRQIYQRSRLHVATPSRWLAEKVGRSMLAPKESRVIPYGVDHSIFHAGERDALRVALGLPVNSLVMLFVANFGKLNPFKDFVTLEQAVKRMKAPSLTDRPIVLIALGGSNSESQLGQVMVKHVAFETEAARVARYYQAADVYLHSAHSDNFPNSILEALACGVPVVATAVGGIPEQVTDEETGFLTPARDPQAMATRLDQLLTNPALRQAMGERAATDSRRRFGLPRQVDAYLGWYAELVEERMRANA